MSIGRKMRLSRKHTMFAFVMPEIIWILKAVMYYTIFHEDSRREHSVESSEMKYIMLQNYFSISQ